LPGAIVGPEKGQVLLHNSMFSRGSKSAQSALCRATVAHIGS
jgi:hypothetical protein